MGDQEGEIILRPVGFIRSFYARPEFAPRQGAYSDDLSRVVIYPEFAHLLEGIERHERLIILYLFHQGRAEPSPGAFAMRTPHRPNPIGLTVVKLQERRENVLWVRGLDAVDGSPVLDVKPFVREIDCPEG